MSSTKGTERKWKLPIYSVPMCQTLLSTKYLLLHLIQQLWGRYHGYINPILQMMKLKFIKVRILAPTPTAGKQQGWDVHPGLAGTNWPCFFHCRRRHPHPAGWVWSVVCSPRSCLALASLWSSYCHALSPVITAKRLHHKCCLFSFFVVRTPIRTDRKTPVFCF